MRCSREPSRRCSTWPTSARSAARRWASRRRRRHGRSSNPHGACGSRRRRRRRQGCPLGPQPQAASGTQPADDATALVIDLLAEAGLVPSPPRGSLDAARARGAGAARQRPRRRLHARRASVHATGGVRRRARHLQARPRCWPARWRDGGTLSDDALVEHDLVTVFQVGWTDASRRGLRAGRHPADRRAGRPSRARSRDAGGARGPAPGTDPALARRHRLAGA